MSDEPADRGLRKIGYKNPPVEHRIKKGERRGPNGRRGNNPAKADVVSNILNVDQIVAEEFLRLVPQADGTEIEIGRRMIQALALDGAKGKLGAQRLFLELAYRREQRERTEQNQLLELAHRYRYEGLAIFENHKRRGLEPPDIIPHPAHVVIDGREVRLAGPIDHEGQEMWECLKRCIAVFTEDLAWARKHVREFPDEEWAHQSLKSAQRHRRKVMRMVPRGWNWREKIWNRASVTQDRERAALIRTIEQERIESEQNYARDRVSESDRTEGQQA